LGKEKLVSKSCAVAYKAVEESRVKRGTSYWTPYLKGFNNIIL